MMSCRRAKKETAAEGMAIARIIYSFMLSWKMNDKGRNRIMNIRLIKNTSRKMATRRLNKPAYGGIMSEVRLELHPGQIPEPVGIAFKQKGQIISSSKRLNLNSFAYYKQKFLRNTPLFSRIADGEGRTPTRCMPILKISHWTASWKHDPEIIKRTALQWP